MTDTAASGISATSALHMSDFDPFGMELRADPFGLFPKLIAQSPGFMMAEGTPSAFVASYADVTAVTRDFKRFSSVKPKDLPGMERFDMFNGQPVMNYSDPPEHTRRRKVVNASFTPKRVETLNANTQTLIDSLLNKAAKLEGVVDGIGNLCQPVTTEVLLGELMDVAPEDRHIFFTAMGGMALLDKLKPGDPKPQPYLDGWAAGSIYIRRVIDEARADPTENLISLIAAASDEGGSIGDGEMMAMMMVLLTGGLTTMSSAAATALYCIAKNPEIKQRIKDDPSVANVALEEAMRLYPPVTLSMRFANTDCDIRGTTIPAGMPVYAIWAAANHDPAEFPEPAKFDIDRPNLKNHVSFGYGIHTCIGNAITRSVAPMMICSMVEHFPDFRLADPDAEPEFSLGTARGRHLLNLPLILQG
ncbi:MAG: cytochrome P450 [Novosphingobium sp.]|nr:cytochrome P450 [Novosphingobium sp.]